MGLISGLLAGGAASLIGNSKTKRMLLFTIAIVEKHRNYLKLQGEQNKDLEDYINRNSKMYYKNLNKL